MTADSRYKLPVNGCLWLQWRQRNAAFSLACFPMNAREDFTCTTSCPSAREGNRTANRSGSALVTTRCWSTLRDESYAGAPAPILRERTATLERRKLASVGSTATRAISAQRKPWGLR